MVEVSLATVKRFWQPVIELLVGIPSVVYGFIGLSVIVPAVRSVFGGTGFGILAGTFVLFIMILPTVTDNDCRLRCEQSQDTIAKPHLLLEQQDGKRFTKLFCGQQFQGF